MRYQKSISHDKLSEIYWGKYVANQWVIAMERHKKVATNTQKIMIRKHVSMILFSFLAHSMALELLVPNLGDNSIFCYTVNDFMQCWVCRGRSWVEFYCVSFGYLTFHVCWPIADFKRVIEEQSRATSHWVRNWVATIEVLGAVNWVLEQTAAGGTRKDTGSLSFRCGCCCSSSLSCCFAGGYLSCWGRCCCSCCSCRRSNRWSCCRRFCRCASSIGRPVARLARVIEHQTRSTCHRVSEAVTAIIKLCGV